MKKRWKKQIDHSLLGETLSRQLEIDPLIGSILTQRGIRTATAARNFLSPTLDRLHDPFKMKDMTEAVQRLDFAIQNGERILLYGDYDVDGTTSVATMYQFLKNYTDNLVCYIPDRYREGYGISKTGIDFAVEQNVNLIIAMDCGIKAIDTIAYANEKNIDSIVCDHHLPGNMLPAAVAVLDPLRSDCFYPDTRLCGVGVSFKLIQAFAQFRKEDPKVYYPLLDLVAIGTACDIVPVLGENRILLRAGLERMNRKLRPGIKAILDQRKKESKLTVSDLVFGVGPVLNAAGRLDDAMLAVDLLLENDPAEAKQKASVLQHKNEERKFLDQQILAEARQKWEDSPDFETANSIVLFEPHWHRGVIGIVASRMVEKFQRPVILLTEHEGKLIGSARSVSTYNIHAGIDACSHLLENFGGHQFAAGLTLKRTKLKAFQEAFEAAVGQSIQPLQKSPVIPVEMIIPLEKINLALWKQVQCLAPFGPGNRNPVFVSKNLVDAGGTYILKNNHLKLAVKTPDTDRVISGIGFGLGERFLGLPVGNLELCYTLEKNTWKGKSAVQLNVKDLRVAKEC